MHRWANCPASVRMSDGLPGKESENAKEGTIAHGLAEQWLKTGKQPECPPEYPDMIDAIQVYVDYVKDRKKKKRGGQKPMVELEHQFHLEHLHPDLWGTADCVVWRPDELVLEVIDYKHGAGVCVEVDDNEQLFYYALGALFEVNVPATTIRITIVQPRFPHTKGPIRSQDIDLVDLMAFQTDLVEAVKRTEDPDAPFKPGDWCRWCKAAAICPELKGKAQELAKMEFSSDTKYDAEELAAALELLPTIEGWAKSVREFAYAEAEHGRCPPRHKLVEKRASRKWRDDGDAIITLRDKLKLEDEAIFERKLRSPAQIEKELGKDKGQIENLVVSVSSGLTLVHESDKREAVRKDARAEFVVV